MDGGRCVVHLPPSGYYDVSMQIHKTGDVFLVEKMYLQVKKERYNDIKYSDADFVWIRCKHIEIAESIV